MARATLPPSRYSGPVTFDETVTFNSTVDMYDRLWIRQVVSGVREALKLTGPNALANIQYVEDLSLNPLHVIPSDGGDAMLGDRRRAFRPGEVINVDFQTLTKTTDNIHTDAGGIQLGHGSGVGHLFFGNGAPSATKPVTTGIPANGSIYFRVDGGAATSVYMVRAGAWVAIL